MKNVLPGTWHTSADGVSLGGVRLTDLAERFGTPLFAVDESHVRAKLDSFREAFGPDTILVYAGKAFLCGALVRLLDETGWWIDVVSAGELELVRRAGFDPRRVVLHGNAKTDAELEEARRSGIGRVVADHPGELDALQASVAAADRSPPVSVLLRLNIDVRPDSQAKVTTVGRGAHFGMDRDTAARAVARLAGAPGIRLSGIHLHAGSQIRDLSTFDRAARAAVAFVEPLRAAFGEVVELDLGGGLAVPYEATDPSPSPHDYAEAVFGGLREARADARLGPDRLLVEPGRSVIANAGITVYRVQARKRLPDLGEVLAVDGGLSDNPRPTMYGAKYEIVCGTRWREPHDARFRVVGRHCESGDVISEAARLPGATKRGDLLVIPVTGAYVYAMSSRYNGLRRPPVIFVRNGRAREVVRRETLEDLLACDLDLGASGARRDAGAA